MKKKKRTLAMLVSLVALSGFTAVANTVAWFTTSRSAFISFKDATIRNRSGNLDVTYFSSLNTMNASESSDDIGDKVLNLTIDYAEEEAKYVTDVSGDGINFTKVNWSSIRNHNGDRALGVSNYKAAEIEELVLENSGDADGYLIDFSVRIARDNKANDPGMLVYLGEDTRILPRVELLDNYDDIDILDDDGNVIDVLTAHEQYLAQQEKNIEATKAARMAVNLLDITEDIDGTPVLPVDPDDDRSVTLVYAQHPENDVLDPQYMYVVKPEDTVNKSAYGLAGYELLEQEEVREGSVTQVNSVNDADGKVITIVDENNDPAQYYDFVSGFESYQNKSQINEIKVDDLGDDLPDWEQPYYHGLVADLATNGASYAYVNFRIWIEGTDTEALNNVIGGVFTVELDLYTVEVL